MINDEMRYKLSLLQFKKYPSEFSAFSCFLSARKCSKEIPDEVLNLITPSIEKAYEEQRKPLWDRINKRTEKFNEKQKLLSLALKEDSIEIACKKYLDQSKDNIEITSVRKRLERFLRDELNSYIKNNAANPSEFLKYFPFKETETASMLEIYREILLMENTGELEI